MTLKQREIKRRIDKFFETRDSKWEQRTSAVLGNSQGVVFSTETPGLVYARLRNGDTIEVYNDVAPDEPDVRVRIGRTKDQPDFWRVIARRESYSVPQAPRIKHHHAQHEFIEEPGPDTTWIGLKQVMSLTVFVLDEADQEDFIVTIIGDGSIEASIGYIEVSSQELDLSSYVPADGALYALLQFDEDGAVTVLAGTPVDAPNLLTRASIPLADTDKFGFAYVMLYADQEKLLNKHIRLIRKLFGGGSALLTIPYGNLTGDISDQADLQAALDAKADADHEHDGSGSALVPVTEDVEVEFCRFDVDGALAVVADASISVLIMRYITLGRPWTYAKNNGTSSSTIIDVNVNGSTIYTTSGNRPTLAHNETYDIAALPDVVDLIPGDVITIDIDQIAGGTPEGLSVILTEIEHALVFDGSELVVEEP